MEHPGGVYLVNHEAQAERELYHRYAAGGVSCGGLASWMNEQGLRTRY